MRELLRLLPQAAALKDATSADPAMPANVPDLARCAEAIVRTIHLGLGALGHLVARCSMDLQDGSVPADSIENLGFLMAELGDLAAECMRISVGCRTTGESLEQAGAHGARE